MRKLVTICALVCLLMTTGCQITKEWVISTAKEVAVQAVDKQISNFNKSYVEPQFVKMEERLGSKVDKNADDLWSEDEIADAIKQQMAPALANTVATLAADSDKKMSEKVKDLATKDDTARDLIMLVILYVLAKLGIKIGPKGFQGLKSYLSKSQTPPKAPNL